jgi:hypothetical protein
MGSDLDGGQSAAKKVIGSFAQQAGIGFGLFIVFTADAKDAEMFFLKIIKPLRSLRLCGE